MIVSIDRAGRVVLPKPLRQQFNLHAGSQLEIITGADGMELKPIETTPSLVKEAGLWVHQGVAQTPLIDAVRQMREERITALSSTMIRKKH